MPTLPDALIRIRSVAAVCSTERDGIAGRDDRLGANGGRVVEIVCADVGVRPDDSVVAAREVVVASIDSKEAVVVARLVTAASKDSNEGVGVAPRVYIASLEAKERVEVSII